MDPRTPVLIGAGRVTQHEDDPGAALEAVELMVRAADQAGRDAGSARVLEQVGMVLVPKGIWSYPDPARLIAARVGAPRAITVLAEVGILQQTLLSRAAEQIAAGTIDAALVVGGEAKHRALRAAIAGVDAAEAQQEGEPDELWLPDDEILPSVEIERDLAVPAHQYAVIESALRHADELSAQAQRLRLGRLGASFAAVAAADPLAWDRSGPSAATIAGPSASNRMVASPYTKLLCSQWNVDQAVALVLTSVAEARRLGIARDRWVFPLAAASSEAMIPLTRRAELHRSPATALAFAAALDHVGLEAAVIDHLDLYSCFPAAVQVQARELGIRLDRGLDRALTVSGGMTFGGGPLNNAMLQSLAAMVDVLRADPGSTGLVTAVSGMLTKPAAGVWSTAEPDLPFCHVDVTEAARAATATRVLDPEGTGSATVVGSTVIHERGVPARTVAIAEFPDGRRTVAVDSDPGAAAGRVEDDLVGRSITVAAPGVWT
ncbi:MAG TPA: hypothetical protein VIJ47_15565 [Acidimicrobiales bacterium]